MNELKKRIFFILTPILLSLSFAPFNLFFLSFIAFLPLLSEIDNITDRKLFFSGFLFNLFNLYWIFNVLKDYGNTGIFFALVLSVLLFLFLSIFFYIPLLFFKKTKFILGFPFVYLMFELILERILTGFPWNSLGYSQAGNPLFKKLFLFGGVYTVTAVILLFNVSLFYVLKKKNFKPLLMLFSTLLIFALTYNPRAEYNRDFKVALIQGNARMDTEWTGELVIKEKSKYIEMSKKSIVKGAELIAWPEFSFPVYPQFNKTFRSDIVKLIKNKATLIMGAIRFENGHAYNTAFVFTPEGEIDFYDKIHLTPFGEYIPFLELFKKIARTIANVEGEFSKGNKIKTFKHKNLRFSIPICYEMLFPNLIKKFYDNGIDFIVTITNDSWFGKSSAPYQHFNISKVRAMELGVPVIRTATSGISGVIDSKGNILDKTKLFKEEFRVVKVKFIRYDSFFYKNYYFFFYFYLILGIVFMLIGFFRLFSKNKSY